MIHDAQSAQISQKQDWRNINAIMETICPPVYHHNGFVATHVLGYMMYGYKLLVPVNQRVLNKLSYLMCRYLYSEPCQTSKTELFAKIANGFKPLNIIKKVPS